MIDNSEDMGMRLRRARKVETITSDIALKLAEMVFRQNYGKSVERQLPLAIKDLDDRWEVRGGRIVPLPQPENDGLGKQLVIVIMKTTCQIMDLSMEILRIQP